MTLKQQRFIDEYLIDLNATQAAIRAGYSAKTAGQIGDENLKKPQIARAVRAAMDERAARTALTADKVLADIERVRSKAEADGQLNTALRASELQGKHLKLFDRGAESQSKERDLIGELLHSLAPTVGPPSLRKPVKGTLIEH
jgi:phage terminase small subunit